MATEVMARVLLAARVCLGGMDNLIVVGVVGCRK